MGDYEIYVIEGLYESTLPEYYDNEEEAILRFTELYDVYNKALGHVLPTMSREVVAPRDEYWNPETEEWECE